MSGLDMPGPRRHPVQLSRAEMRALQSLLAANSDPAHPDAQERRSAAFGITEAQRAAERR